MALIDHWMRMRYFNFRSHGNRELRSHGDDQENPERCLGVLFISFLASIGTLDEQHPFF